MSDAALTLAEGIPLGYALTLRAAADVGARCLAIKGPVPTQQGLRAAAMVSADVDVLVDPMVLPTVQARLERLGWYDSGVYDTRGTILPLHSVTFRHPLWPCEIDLHHWFPGFLADPSEVFDVLWARRTSVRIAHIELQTCDRAGTAAVLALNYLRDVQRTAPLEELAALVRTWSPEQLEDLAELAADTGSGVTMRPFLDAVQAPVIADRRGLVVPVEDWTIRSQTSTTEVFPWLVQLGRTTWWRRPAFVWRAVWMRDATFAAWDPSAGLSRRALLRARGRRLSRALRALPLARAENKRLRRR